MPVSINGVSSYATKTRGTAQSFIRVAVVNAADVTNMDLDETAGLAANGTATANFGGTVVGGDATGLVNDTTAYTASISIDGTAYAISVVGSAAQTFTDLITEINADLPGTEASIVSGNIVIASGTTGLSSYCTITDVDLFASSTGYTSQVTTVDGGILGQLKGRTLGNGANAYTAYAPAEEVYNPADAKTAILTDYVRGNLNATFSDVEVEAELDLVKAKLDALQSIAK